MMTRQHQVVQIIDGSGWIVVYWAYPEGPSPTLLYTDPVVAWALVDYWDDAGFGRREREDRLVEPMVWYEGYASCLDVENTDNVLDVIREADYARKKSSLEDQAREEQRSYLARQRIGLDK